MKSKIRNEESIKSMSSLMENVRLLALPFQATLTGVDRRSARRRC